MRKMKGIVIKSTNHTLTKKQLDEIRNQIMKSMNNFNIRTYIEPRNLYQEPERDEQGVFYAYKVLNFRDGNLYSPLRASEWSREGVLESDREPHKNNSNGIYFCKTQEDDELRTIELYYGYRYTAITVKCALSGIVIEGETGFRSQYAQIVAVRSGREWISYGHWKDYKDTQRSQSHPRDFAQEEEVRYTTVKSWQAFWDSSPNVASEEDGEGS